MCGRYTLAGSIEEIAAHFNLHESFAFKARYNVAPAEMILTVNTARRVHFMRWGFKPHWAKNKVTPYINARFETLSEKPSFKAAFAQHRCLIPATGYYEWFQSTPQHRKQPYYISMPGQSLFALAGIWSTYQDPETGLTEETVAIVTQPASKKLHHIHARQPLILLPDQYNLWLHTKGSDVLQETFETPFEGVQYFPVSTQVNKPQHDTPQCIEALV